MLSYENQMFLDVLHEDGLLVAARGLGLEHVLYSLIKVRIGNRLPSLILVGFL